MSTTAESTRDAAGRFLPGKSGNPAGRPSGRREKWLRCKRGTSEAERRDARKFQRVLSELADSVLQQNCDEQ